MEQNITLKDFLKEILEPIIDESLARAMNKYINTMALDPPNDSGVFDLEEASRYMKLSKQTMYSFTSKRIIPHYKQGRHLFFRKEELDQWINIGKVKVDDFESAANKFQTYRNRSV